MAVLLAVDAHSLIDDDLIVPFDTVATPAEDQAWLDSFYPAFLRNGRIGGHTWGIPFQRSTIVLYWNKPLFAQAGLTRSSRQRPGPSMRRRAAKLTRARASAGAR